MWNRLAAFVLELVGAPLTVAYLLPGIIALIACVVVLTAMVLKELKK